MLDDARKSLPCEVLKIGYDALLFQPIQGMDACKLAMTMFVYVDNQIVAQSAPNPFGLRW
jgi:hypothetical protein